MRWSEGSCDPVGILFPSGCEAGVGLRAGLLDCPLAGDDATVEVRLLELLLPVFRRRTDPDDVLCDS
jgi:hypothetical protein